ncbi:hypothetical protein [Thalassomonas actiniarum]|uniref:Uncharacterized protein n=1 Tax=Thalassomonas actiniarum TaxID=485447 RepID=A0AAE9YQA5_9GAMM|nr:hypothetical protein [Thalassomonas actiniarum]WDD99090.1 hypothetical protein SG35_028385 [Thalassomonas actiniarum]
MKKLIGLVFCSLMVSQAAAADVVYVSGSKHNLSKADFQRSGNTYTANIEVVGDYGQTLIFDIDAIVAGRGYQDNREVCFTYHPDEPPCHESYTEWLPNFRYVVDLKVSCNGIAIGLDSENKNMLVNEGVRVRDTGREVSLLIDNELVTGGNCQQLQVIVDGTELSSIDSIDLDVLVAEAF